MIITDYIQTLYTYNAWANNQILAQAANLSPEQFLAQEGASFDSVRDTLVHTMSAQWIWLSRWQGASPSAMLAPTDYPTIETIQTRWAEIEAETQTFVSALTAERLGQAIDYANTSGKKNRYLLWQMMVHQVNHATQHRSEVAMILTRYGYSPGALDMIYYF